MAPSGLGYLELGAAALSLAAGGSKRVRVPLHPLPQGVGPERWSRRQDSNPRPAVYKTAALPLSYAGQPNAQSTSPLDRPHPFGRLSGSRTGASLVWDAGARGLTSCSRPLQETRSGTIRPWRRLASDPVPRSSVRFLRLEAGASRHTDALRHPIRVPRRNAASSGMRVLLPRNSTQIPFRKGCCWNGSVAAVTGCCPARRNVGLASVGSDADLRTGALPALPLLRGGRGWAVRAASGRACGLRRRRGRPSGAQLPGSFGIFADASCGSVRGSPAPGTGLSGRLWSGVTRLPFS